MRVTLNETIDASPQVVWAILSDIEGLPNREQAVERIEFLSEQRSGVGTRFRETRSMGSRTVATELEVTEVVPDESIRFVSDAGGTVWDTVYRCHPDGSPPGTTTRLEIDMDARPHKLAARLMNSSSYPWSARGW